MLSQLLDDYNSLIENKEQEHFKRLMLKLLNDQKNKAFTRESLAAHFTASAWILNPTRDHVLLLHHKKLNKWLQPGGHADGDMDMRNVALKEAEEETGLKNLQEVDNKIFDLDIHQIPEHKGTPAHYHYDIRFSFINTQKEMAIKNHESNDLRWIALKDIEKYTNEESIIRMVRKSTLN